jgi:magnesium-transporting ATPase (P-type)
MSIWKTLLKIVAIILLIIAIIYLVLYLWAAFVTGQAITGAGYLMLGLQSLSATALLAISMGALVLATLIDKKTVAKYVGKASGAIGEVVTVIGDAAGDVIGSVGGSMLKSPYVLLALGVAVFVLLS